MPLSDAQFVVTNEYNEVDGFDGVYVIGDSACSNGSSMESKTRGM